MNAAARRLVQDAPEKALALARDLMLELGRGERPFITPNEMRHLGIQAAAETERAAR